MADVVALFLTASNFWLRAGMNPVIVSRFEMLSGTRKFCLSNSEKCVVTRPGMFQSYMEIAAT